MSAMRDELRQLIDQLLLMKYLFDCAVARALGCPVGLLRDVTHSYYNVTLPSCNTFARFDIGRA